jgi:hypothetical protein
MHTNDDARLGAALKARQRRREGPRWAVWHCEEDVALQQVKGNSVLLFTLTRQQKVAPLTET